MSVGLHFLPTAPNSGTFLRKSPANTSAGAVVTGSHGSMHLSGLYWFDTNILKPVRMRSKYKDVNVRHENKSKSLIFLYYSVSLMMAFTKKKSLKRITMLFACDTVMKLFNQNINTQLMSEQK